MSLLWGVLPLDPDQAELIDWLREHGIAAPPARGRRPTPDELLAALAALGVEPLAQTRHSENLWSLSVGVPRTDAYAHMLGTLVPDGRLDFHFQGQSCDEMTMLRILRLVAAACGPQICYSPVTATPVLITADTDVAAALADWEERQRAGGWA